MGRDKEEIELPDILFSDDDLIEVFYKKRNPTKDKVDLPALMEVWHCFKEYLDIRLRDSNTSRIKINSYITLQKKFNLGVELKKDRCFENLDFVAYLMEYELRKVKRKNVKAVKEFVYNSDLSDSEGEND